MFASFITSANEYQDALISSNNNTLITSVPVMNFSHPETPHVLYDIIQDDMARNNDDTMRIYLRLRPLPNRESPFTVCGSNAVCANPPEQSANYKNLLHGYGKGYQKFAFTKVLSETTNQQIVFNETTRPFLDDFIRGNDRLLFTYGTTSSGKTFTMTGNKSNIGIIPRALNRLFKAVKLSNNPSLMPVDFSEICGLKKVDVQKILREKSQLLKLSERESVDLLNVLDDDDVSLSEINSSANSGDNNNNSSNNAGEYETTFWLSYTEIYNELIYDLLDPLSTGNNNHSNNNNIFSNFANNNKLKRPILDIRTARNGGSYIRGLRSFPVFSAEEAYRLVLVGRRNQSVGATKLNQNSSRSHSIVTIRAVRSMPGSEYLSRVSNFSFCDLAGSERTEKAQTSGQMQKEAANINTSLLALGRCLDVIKHNQTNGAGGAGGPRLVPYRDSKLTRLFQTFLAGNGRAAMIVCLNQDPALFDESLQVMKFSSLARKIVMHEKEKPELKPGVAISKERLSLFKRLGMTGPNQKGVGDLSDADLEEESEDGDDDENDRTVENDDSDDMEEVYDYKELLNVIECLKAELIATRKEKVVNEARLREQINNEWSQTIMEMERDNAQNMKNLRAQMQEEMQRRSKNERTKAFRQLKRRKLHSIEQEEEQDGLESSDADETENLALTVDRQNREINDLKASLKESQEEAAENRETIEMLQSEKEQLIIQVRTLEFQIAAGSQVTRSSLSSSKKLNRFSVISTNPNTVSKQNRPKNLNSVSTPISEDNEEQSIIIINNDQNHSLSNSNNSSNSNQLFTIYVKNERNSLPTSDSENDNNHVDQSFIEHERRCERETELERQLSELQSGWNRLGRVIGLPVDAEITAGAVCAAIERVRAALDRIDKENSSSQQIDSRANQIAERILTANERSRLIEASRYELVQLINRSIIDEARSKFRDLETMESVTTETSMVDIADRLAMIWDCVIDRINQSSSIHVTMNELSLSDDRSYQSNLSQATINTSTSSNAQRSYQSNLSQTSNNSSSSSNHQHSETIQRFTKAKFRR